MNQGYVPVNAVDYASVKKTVCGKNATFRSGNGLRGKLAV
jgi:hypothetical protein